MNEKKKKKNACIQLLSASLVECNHIICHLMRVCSYLKVKELIRETKSFFFIKQAEPLCVHEISILLKCQHQFIYCSHVYYMILIFMQFVG